LGIISRNSNASLEESLKKLLWLSLINVLEIFFNRYIFLKLYFVLLIKATFNDFNSSVKNIPVLFLPSRHEIVLKQRFAANKFLQIILISSSCKIGLCQPKAK
jgi:hypothetical protein